MIRDANSLIRSDVDRTLTALARETPDIDRAAVRLAREYADAIDRAAHTAEAADRLMDSIPDRMGYGPEAADVMAELHRLAIKLEHQVVLANLGPKLLATLDALGATPKARKGAGGQPAKTGGKLQAIRDQRAG